MVAENEVSEDEMSDSGGTDQLSKDSKGKMGYDQSQGEDLDDKEDEYGEGSNRGGSEAGDMKGN